MSRLSWRDTASPNFGSSVSDVVRANKLLQDSIGGISTGLGNFSAANKAAQVDAAARAKAEASGLIAAEYLRSAGDADGTQQITQGLADHFAANPSQFGMSDAKAFIDQYGTSIDQNTSRVGLDKNIYDNNRSQGFDRANDAYVNNAAEILRRQQVGDVAGANRLQQESMDLVGNLNLKDLPAIFAAGSAERNSFSTNQSTRDSNARGWNEDGRSAKRFDNEQTVFGQSQAKYIEGENARTLASEAARRFSDPLDASRFIYENASTPAERQTALQLLGSQVTAVDVEQMFRGNNGPAAKAGGQGVGGTGAAGGEGSDVNFSNYNLQQPTVAETAGNNAATALKRATDQAQGADSVDQFISLGSSKKSREDVIAEIAERTGGSTSDIGRAFQIINEETGGTLKPEQVRMIYEDSIVDLSGGQQLYNVLNRVVPFTPDVIDIGSSNLFGAIPSDRVTTKKSLQDSISKFNGPRVAESTEKSQRQADEQAKLSAAQKLLEDAKRREEAERLRSLATGTPIDPRMESGTNIAESILEGTAFGLGNNPETTPLVPNPINRSGAYVPTPEANKIIKEQKKAQDEYQAQNKLIESFRKEIKDRDAAERLDTVERDIGDDFERISEWERYQAAMEEERQRNLSKVESQRLSQYKQQIKDSRVELMKARLALAKTTEGVGSDFRKRMKALDTINRMEKKIPELMFKVEELSE